MPTLDIAMPIALFAVLIAALYLSKRVSGQIEQTIEGKKFETRDVVLLVVFMVVAVSGLAYVSIINPGALLQYAILIFFLFAYSSLLFTTSFVFSKTSKVRAIAISVAFGILGLLIGSMFLLSQFRDDLTVFRVGGFFGFAIFCFIAAILVSKETSIKPRWYLAAQPPAIFALLFIFLSILGNEATAAIWSPYILDVFALTFAILIILNLSSLFNWKTVGLFAVLLTSWDIIAVIATPIMITAAHTFTGLELPLLVYLPNIPIVISHLATTGAPYVVFRGLGLGDFFFAGILVVQTYRKFGQKMAIIAIAAITISFGIWDAYLYDIINWFTPVVGRNIGGLPATMFIITGWVPVVVGKLLYDRRKRIKAPNMQQQNGPMQEPKAENTPYNNH